LLFNFAGIRTVLGVGTEDVPWVNPHLSVGNARRYCGFWHNLGRGFAALVILLREQG
jgi:hypothetical protein